MAEIEGFHTIMSSLVLAKELRDIGRDDVLGQFCDILCWENYYDNMLGAISSVFAGFQCYYIEDDEAEIMIFEDDVISNYFIHAWEYGKLHNLHYSQNPYVLKAQNEAQRWFNGNCCIAWKNLAYIRTRKSAEQSGLLVQLYNGCGSCHPHEILAYGLIQSFTWFKNQCDEFEALKPASSKPKEDISIICTEPVLDNPEVMAA